MYNHELRFAEELARKTGGFLLEGFAKQGSPGRHRHEKELTTRWDRQAERIIIKAVEKAFPKDNILTEETGFIDKKGSRTWIVDPLDGTGNFTRRNPLFSVSIALIKKEELIIGAIFAPVTSELFTAQKNKGASLNGEKIGVSSTDNLDTAYLVSCEGGERDRERFARLYIRIRRSVIDMRKLGSAALECAYVASGRADGYLTTKIEPWDVAAGVLLVQEAGGRVTDFKGNPWRPVKTDLAVSNGLIHDELLVLAKDA